MTEITREVWATGPDGPVLESVETVTVDDATADPGPIDVPDGAVFFTADAVQELRSRAAAATTIAALRAALTAFADKAEQA